MDVKPCERTVWFQATWIGAESPTVAVTTAESHIGVARFGAHCDEAGRNATAAPRLILLECVELSQSPSIEVVWLPPSWACVPRLRTARHGFVLWTRIIAAQGDSPGLKTF